MPSTGEPFWDTAWFKINSPLGEWHQGE